MARNRLLVTVLLILAGLWLTIRSAAPDRPNTVRITVAGRDLPAGHRLTGDDLHSVSWLASDTPRGLLTDPIGRSLASPVRAGEPLTNARVLGPGLLTGQARGMVATPVRLSDPGAATILRPGDLVDVLASSTMSTTTDLAPPLDDPSPPDDTSADIDPNPPSAPDPNSTPVPTPTPTSAAALSPQPPRTKAERIATSAEVLAVPGSAVVQGGASAGGFGGLGSELGPAGQPDSASDGGLVVLAVSPQEAARLAATQTRDYIGIVILPTAAR